MRTLSKLAGSSGRQGKGRVEGEEEERRGRKRER